MKKLCILLLAAFAAFALTACGGGGDRGTPETETTATYSGEKDGQTYTLTISEGTGLAAYTPKANDDYVLIFGSSTSEGIVISFSGGVFTLKPSNSESTFTANVSGSGITSIDGGTITLTNGSTVPTPGALTPTTPPPAAGGFTTASGVNTLFRGSIEDIVYSDDDGLFVAVGGYASSSEDFTSSTIWSTDGVNWTSGALSTPMDAYSVAYGGGSYVMVGTAGSYPVAGNPNPSHTSVSYSTDGKVWTNVDTPDLALKLFGQANFEAVAYGENRFVAVGQGPNALPGSIEDAYPRAYIYYSVDGGQNWIESNMSWFFDWMDEKGLVSVNPASGANGMLYDISYDGEKFYAVGSLYASGIELPCIISSEDGDSWEIVFEEGDENGVGIFSSIAYGSGVYVAGTRGAHIYWSTDGENWARQNRTDDASSPNHASLFSSWIESIIFGNGEFMAVSDDGEIGRSTDGSTWSKTYPNPFLLNLLGSQTVHGVAYGAGRYVVAGDDGDDTPKVIYSELQ